MLTETEVRYIHDSVKATLVKYTPHDAGRVDTLLALMAYGRFTWAFSCIARHMPWWRIRKNCEIRRQVSRLLVPEYMCNLTALRNLIELKKHGFDLRHNYEFIDNYQDITRAAFRLRRRKVIGGQLLVRFLARIEQLSPKV